MSIKVRPSKYMPTLRTGASLINSPPFPEEVFIELMKTATRSVEFSFNNEMYQQKDGVAMGSPLGPALANIFVGFYEERLFDCDQKPGVYFGMWMTHIPFSKQRLSVILF